MIRKLYLAFPNPYPFVILEGKHFVLFCPCVFREEEYRNTSHFPHKSFLPTVYWIPKAYASTTAGFLKEARRVSAATPQQDLCKSPWKVLTWNLRMESLTDSNHLQCQTVQLIWWLQLSMWSPYAILSP